MPIDDDEKKTFEGSYVVTASRLMRMALPLLERSGLCSAAAMLRCAIEEAEARGRTGEYTGRGG